MTLTTFAVVDKVLKKSSSPAFKNLSIGDKVKFSIEIESVGGNKGTYAAYINCENLQNNTFSSLSFNQIGRVLSNFEWIETDKVEDLKEVIETMKEDEN